MKRPVPGDPGRAVSSFEAAASLIQILDLRTLARNSARSSVDREASGTEVRSESHGHGSRSSTRFSSAAEADANAAPNQRSSARRSAIAKRAGRTGPRRARPPPFGVPGREPHDLAPSLRSGARNERVVGDARGAGGAPGDGRRDDRGRGPGRRRTADRPFARGRSGRGRSPGVGRHSVRGVRAARARRPPRSLPETAA